MAGVGVSIMESIEAEKHQLGQMRARYHGPGRHMGIFIAKHFFPITLFPGLCEWWGYFLPLKKVLPYVAKDPSALLKLVCPVGA